MCLILFSFHQHPKHKLLLLANRDEFYERPTMPAHWWEDHPNVVGGKDLQQSGSWLALTKSGKFAAITNYRDPNNINSDAPSRGNLIKDYLTGPINCKDYLKVLQQTGSQYNGFNLLFGNQNRLYYYSNYAKEPYKLKPGIYGLSNALLDTAWPKVTRGKNKLMEIVNSKGGFSVSNAQKALKDNLLAADKELPDTGIGLEKEKMLSPMFIETPVYGTRCTTVVSIDYDDKVTFNEISYHPKGKFQTAFDILREGRK